jgi:hypothetical protein
MITGPMTSSDKKKKDLFSGSISGPMTGNPAYKSKPVMQVQQTPSQVAGQEQKQKQQNIFQKIGTGIKNVAETLIPQLKKNETPVATVTPRNETVSKPPILPSNLMDSLWKNVLPANESTSAKLKSTISTSATTPTSITPPKDQFGLPSSTISQSPKPTIGQSITNWFNQNFGNSTEQQVARAQNAYAVAKTLSTQEVTKKRVGKSGLNPDGSVNWDVVGELAKPGMSITGNSPMENISKDLGLRGVPTNADFTQAVMALSIGSGLAEAPLVVLKSLGIFTGVSAVTTGLIHILSGGKANTLSDLVPTDNPTIKGLVDVAEFLALGKATHLVYTKSPALFESMTKDIITKYNLPQTITIDSQDLLSMSNKASNDAIKTLGLNENELTALRKQGLKGKPVAIEVPASKVTLLADKPYWETIKKFFKLPLTPENPITTYGSGQGKTVTSIAGLLPAGVPPEATFNPPDLIDHVNMTDLKGTPLGDEMIAKANSTDKMIQVFPVSKVGTNTFKNPTPAGGYLGYQLAGSSQPVKPINTPPTREIIKLDKTNYPGMESGMAIIRPDGTASLDVRFTSEAQGKGQGTEAVKTLEQKVLDKGITTVNIDSFPEAVGFWEKMGYTPTKEVAEGKNVPMTKTLDTSTIAQPKVAPTESLDINKLKQEKVKTPAISEVDQLQEYVKNQRGNQTPERQKGIAMEYSAIKRNLAGNPTANEFSKAKQYLETNYFGKKVEVDGKSGTVTKTSFGKVGIKFEDNTVKFVSPDLVIAKRVTDNDVLALTKKQAQDKLNNEKLIHSNFKPVVSIESPQITAKNPPPTPPKEVSAPQAQKEMSPTDKLKSRVYERMKSEHPELQDSVFYDQATFDKEFKKATDLIATDKQKAYEVAMQKIPASEAESVATNIALAERALQEGNNDLFGKLVANRSIAQTRRGQAIVFEKASVTDNSTTKYVKELLDTRLDSVGKKYLSDIRKESVKKNATKVIDRKVKELGKKITNKKLDVKTALSLLDELECV